MVLTKYSDTNERLVEQQAITIKERNRAVSSSERLRAVSEQKMDIESSLKEERTKTENLQQENESLKVNLQAKKEREAQEAQAVQLASAQKTQVAQAQQPAPTVQVSGDKQSWLAASGIPESEWQYVDFIVSKESGWNPNAVNASSGACGLGQQLPCGKWSGAWNDPVAALQAQHGYVKDRYGSYAGAVGFWQANNYY